MSAVAPDVEAPTSDEERTAQRVVPPLDLAPASVTERMIRDGGFQPPSVSAARAHGKTSLPNDDGKPWSLCEATGHYSCCSCKSASHRGQKFAQEFGIGVSLYFRYMLLMGICFSIMTVLTLPNLLLLTFAGLLDDRPGAGIERTTLANVPKIGQACNATAAEGGGAGCSVGFSPPFLEEGIGRRDAFVLGEAQRPVPHLQRALRITDS